MEKNEAGWESPSRWLERQIKTAARPKRRGVHKKDGKDMFIRERTSGNMHIKMYE